MSNTDFAPGPWTLKDINGAGLQIHVDVSSVMGKDFAKLVSIYELSDIPPNFYIAYERWVQFPKRDWDEMQKANGNLIAASPDLYDALNVLVTYFDGQETPEELFNAVLNGHTALKKARGEA